MRIAACFGAEKFSGEIFFEQHFLSENGRSYSQKFTGGGPNSRPPLYNFFSTFYHNYSKHEICCFIGLIGHFCDLDMGVRIHFRAPKIGSKKLESKI